MDYGRLKKKNLILLYTKILRIPDSQPLYQVSGRAVYIFCPEGEGGKK